MSPRAGLTSTIAAALDKATIKPVLIGDLTRTEIVSESSTSSPTFPESLFIERALRSRVY